MFGYLIKPKNKEIRQIRLGDDSNRIRAQICVVLKTSILKEISLFLNGDILCLPEGYEIKHGQVSFTVDGSEGLGHFYGKAFIIGRLTTKKYFSPATSLRHLQDVIQFPEEG